MTQQVCLITGGNSGVGYSIAKKMAELQYHVVITCRSKEKGEQAIENILKSYPMSRVDFIVGNFSSITSSKEIGEEIKGKFSSIDLIFFNAGIWPTKKRINSDGLEEAFMVNYLSMYILYKILKPNIMENGRIVIVNAGLFVNGVFSIDKTPYGNDFGRFKTYANTKLCGVLFMQKIVRLKANDFIINATHPGVFRTGLGNSWGPLGILVRLVKLFWKSPKKSFVSPLYLATSDDVKESGEYYNGLEKFELPAGAKDELSQDALWELSYKLTKI